MQKAIGVLVVAAIAFAGLLSIQVGTVQAVPPFKKEFDKLYIKKDSTDPAEKSLATAVDKVKCNVCHKGKDKKMRNAYGEELAKLLDKKADAKNPQKIIEALEKVAEMPSNADDKSSLKFGELLKEGKLPGGADDTKDEPETEVGQ